MKSLTLSGNDAEQGASAVEFALLSPIFILLLLGMVCYGTLFGIYHGVQQITAEAARAAVAGLSDTERSQIVQSFLVNNIANYAFLDPQRIQISSQTTDPVNKIYTVSVTYDASTSYVYSFNSIVPLPNPTVQRNSVIQRGGY